MKSALDLRSGPGYAERLQAVLFEVAQLPGIRDQVCVCARCGKTGRPHWSLIGIPDATTMRPLPLGWSMSNSLPSGDVVCDDCFGHALDTCLAAMRAYIVTQAGRDAVRRQGPGPNG